MKEELIRVLNNKLNDLNSDIDSLVEINNKIDKENDNLSYVSSILDLFGDNNILNFSKVSREDFDKVIDIIGENARAVFDTDSCNYDGLVYLINGINSGITLELNEEQKNAINYVIDELNSKVDEYSSAIDGYELVKTRYDISDVEELKSKRDNYNKTIGDLENENYVVDTDLLMEALNYCDLSEEKIISILGYVLGYNAEVYKEKGPREEKPKSEPVIETYDEPKVNDEIKFDNNEIEETEENNVFSLENNEHYIEPSGTREENEYHEDVDIPEYSEDEIITPTEDMTSLEDEFHFNSIPSESIQEYNPVTFEEEPKEEKIEEVEYNTPVEEYVPSEDIMPAETSEIEDIHEEDNNVTFEESHEEEVSQESNAPLDNDFKDVIDSNEDYEDKEDVSSGEMSSTRDLQKLFDKYGVKEDNVYLNELVTGNTSKYPELLEVLKNKELLDKLSGNVLAEVLLNSNSDDIIQALDIIENDLSVDKDDYTITVKIAIDTIPSIFITENGNFRNFVENTRLFKDLGLNLINLFDFSKELFVANHDTILKNLDVVKSYGFDIDYKNAKYLLLIPNIGDKLDYYVESIYEDKLKNMTFDGIEYIKNYAAKLNVVTDETIKRIRYSSENGRKVFGTKPGSLTGEITNLRVNALDISSDYLNKFFNNDFADLTGDEVREYERLVHNSTNVGDYSDELEVLNPYLKGLRYVIDGINISSKKVVRNYNILRSYDTEKKKALEFAVCYNLVITKEEYDRLESKLNEIGGNL